MKVVLALMISMCLMISGSALAGDPDLMFYFSYDTPIDGDTITGESDNALKGVINGNADLVDGGKRGKAMKFEVSSFIDLDGANLPEEIIPTEAITICAWVKCENTGGHHAILNARAGDATWLMHPELRSEGNFRWLLRSDGSATIFDMRAGAVTWDEWLHFAGVYTGKKAILYINGESVGEQSASGAIASDWAQGARIGLNIDAARPFVGLMDDMCVWGRELTQDEVKLVMANGPGGIFDEAVSPVGNLTATWGGLKAR